AGDAENIGVAIDGRAAVILLEAGQGVEVAGAFEFNGAAVDEGLLDVEKASANLDRTLVGIARDLDGGCTNSHELLKNRASLVNERACTCIGYLLIPRELDVKHSTRVVGDGHS